MFWVGLFRSYDQLGISGFRRGGFRVCRPPTTRCSRRFPRWGHECLGSGFGIWGFPKAGDLNIVP